MSVFGVELKDYILQ